MFGFILFAVMVILYYSIYFSSSAKRRYIMKKKLRDIDYKKALKHWAVIQAFVFLCSINNKMMNWYDVVSFPVLLVGLFICSAVTRPMQHDIRYSLDYDSRVEERNRKLDKLLKKRWL
jgi:O-antigen/teichoic acid export membrane protein